MNRITELPTDLLLAEYNSPLGEIILASSCGVLRGLWFTDQKYACAGISSFERVTLSDDGFYKVRLWLDGYFGGAVSLPDFPFDPVGTVFQKTVWAALAEIPYGAVSTYKEIAEKVGCKSARAVGSAIGRNPISIVIPCHRVIGSNGSMTGYAGGLERKRLLLALERETVKSE